MKLSKILPVPSSYNYFVPVHATENLQGRIRIRFLLLLKDPDHANPVHRISALSHCRFPRFDSPICTCLVGDVSSSSGGDAELRQPLAFPVLLAAAAKCRPVAGRDRGVATTAKARAVASRHCGVVAAVVKDPVEDPMELDGTVACRHVEHAAGRRRLCSRLQHTGFQECCESGTIFSGSGYDLISRYGSDPDYFRHVRNFGNKCCILL